MTKCKRQESLGPLRKAHPASGATFNVQVVRGKMSGKCLLHACRALSIGLFLMFIGGGMATIGYFTHSAGFATNQPTNMTTAFRTKNENRGLHLNNLSYLGPIVMGVGGFIVVAACVITFEMRDSAAKVMPARFKVSNTKNGVRSTNSKRGMSKAQWEQQLGVFRTSPADAIAERRATTAALVHFSKTFGSPKPVPMRRLSKSDSVPNLLSGNETKKSPVIVKRSPMHRHHHRHRRRSRGHNSLVQRSTRDISSGLLHPGMLQFHKAALSFDEADTFMSQSRKELTSSPQGSVKFDPYPMVINEDELQRARTRRSDTARRHVLARQRPVMERDDCAARPRTHRRRSSTISDGSTRFGGKRRQSSGSATSTADSRMNLAPAEIDIMSPSFERRFRSQISICSEPPPVLSCQSSIEPSVPEESQESEKSHDEVDTTQPIPPKPIASTSISISIEEPEDTQQSSNKLHRSSSTKSYREKTFNRIETRRSNEAARLYAMQALRRNSQTNRDDIEVIHERRNKIFMSMQEPSIDISEDFYRRSQVEEDIPQSAKDPSDSVN